MKSVINILLVCMLASPVFAQLKQPYEWDGVANPMALLPRRPSSNLGHAVLLDSDFDTLYRNRFSGKSRNTLGRKERRLREQAPVEMGWAQSPDERRKVLDEFFKQKSRQFLEQGISDAFSEPSHRAFYHEIASRPSGEQGTLEIGYLRAGNQVAAISSGTFFKDKFTTMLTSINEGPVLKFDESWEGPFCGYCTVIRDRDKYRFYYRGLPEAAGW